MINKIYNRINYSKALEWSKLIAITGGAQIIIQLISLISGILVIRLLSTQEYAFYTLTNVVLGTITILADGGITSSVMAQGGKVWQNSDLLGKTISTGFDLRKKFGFVSILISLPILFYLLHHHGASLLMSFLISISIIPAFISALSGTLLEVVFKLRQDILPLQKIQVGNNIGRLVLVAISLFLFPYTFLAIIAAGISQIWANWQLRKKAAAYVDWQQKPDQIIQKEILEFVKRVLPNSIYYCISGQIAIWLISIFGSTEGVAEIGALGRLVVIMTIFSVLFSTLIIPRFARMPDEKKLLMSKYIQIILGLVLLSGIIVISVWLFSDQLLFILGANYEHLKDELVLSMVASCISLISGIAFSLYTSRGWAIHPVIAIPINILFIIMAILIYNVTTIEGILYMNILIAFSQLLLNASYCLIKIMNIKNNSING